MRKMRYAVYDTWQHKYLKRATQPLGRGSELVTEWTGRAENAQRFPGIKSAEAMLEKLGRFSEYVIVNGKGDIVA